MFAKADSDLLELEGFYSHHARAIPRPGSRNVWGLSSYFRTAAFVDGFWVKIFTSVEWILVSRWKSAATTGITVINMYIPAHTRGFVAHDIDILRSTFDDLVVTFPGDFFIVAGDFNFDRYKRNNLKTGMAK
jgi:hypothetical protein